MSIPNQVTLSAAEVATFTEIIDALEQCVAGIPLDVSDDVENAETALVWRECVSSVRQMGASVAEAWRGYMVARHAGDGTAGSALNHAFRTLLEWGESAERFAVAVDGLTSLRDRMMLSSSADQLRSFAEAVRTSVVPPALH